MGVLTLFYTFLPPNIMILLYIFGKIYIKWWTCLLRYRDVTGSKLPRTSEAGVASCTSKMVSSLSWLQTTQPTSGGAVTSDSSCCVNCVEPPRPQQWGSDLPFFGHAGHADLLDGWRCCSQKRVMSIPIQVRQL